MRERNRADLAGFAHACHGVVIDQRDAVPQQVAARRTHQQRALADREAWLGADAEQAFGLRFDAVAMRVAQRFERGPLLPAAADVLALVLADRTTVRLARAIDKLGPAGGADEVHDPAPGRAPQNTSPRARLVGTDPARSDERRGRTGGDRT